ncbi:UNKNOWN [Stylonychia lemnae]|uniref:Uncharacterized protein n=1 Tax=Stylonychia lemnae TaxID=5949 RepID=A0A078A6M2_STYLE|nr:UNKNOWN [Stylonychia lemnae]|eukprot:CDW77885.1 UNKNOWN [Stylonychia lemnae]
MQHQKQVLQQLRLNKQQQHNIQYLKPNKFHQQVQHCLSSSSNQVICYSEYYTINIQPSYYDFFNYHQNESTTSLTTKMTTTTTTEAPDLKQCKECVNFFGITDQSPDSSERRHREDVVLKDTKTGTRKFLDSDNGSQNNSKSGATLRIKTNSLPNQCFSTFYFVIQHRHQLYQLKMTLILKWNSKTPLKQAKLQECLLSQDRQSQKMGGSDQDTVNSILCDTTQTNQQYVQQVSPSYTEYSGNYMDIVGIAINGVHIHTGNSEYGFDIFFLQKYGDNIYSGSSIDLDTCLGSAQFQGFYNYYGLPLCILPSGPIKNGLSSNSNDITECKIDKLIYSISFMKPEDK